MQHKIIPIINQESFDIKNDRWELLKLICRFIYPDKFAFIVDTLINELDGEFTAEELMKQLRFLEERELIIIIENKPVDMSLILLKREGLLLINEMVNKGII